MKFKSFLPFFLALPFIFIIGVIQLNLPTVAQAKPLAGFTPTPVPPDGGGGGGGGGDDDDDSPTNGRPSDYVLVQVGRCNLQCSAGSADLADQPDLQPLASLDATATSNPPLMPPANPSTLPELLLPVRLVHDGSGFIVEGELSDMKPTRFAVPYPGRWQVWITGSPRFMTAEAVDVTGFNLADLQSQLASGPVSLGVVEADIPEPQLVNCPLACVVDMLPTVEAPPHLPQTGEQPETGVRLSTFLIMGGLNLGLMSVMLWAACRHSIKKRYS